MTYVIWKCGSKCQEVKVSISGRHHQMDICSCGDSGLDLEEYVCRFIGNVKTLKSLNYNFFDELIIDFREQGFFEELEDAPNRFHLIMSLRDIEDDILKDLLKDYR